MGTVPSTDGDGDGDGEGDGEADTAVGAGEAGGDGDIGGEAVGVGVPPGGAKPHPPRPASSTAITAARRTSRRWDRIAAS